MKSILFTAIILCVIGGVDGFSIFSNSILENSKTATAITTPATQTFVTIK